MNGYGQTHETHARLCEGAILRDIAYFQDEVRSARRSGTPGAREVGAYYEPFIRRRRQLLAALRGGRPSSWRSYSAS